MTVGPPPASASSQQLHGFSKQQVEKAARALLAHLGKQRGRSGGGGNDLFDDDDELLYMIVSLKKVPQERRNDKPVRIAIPHPIYRFDGAEVCLIVKDAPGDGFNNSGGQAAQRGGNKAAKAKAKAQRLAGAAGVSKVIAVSKLKSKYEPHEAKRALANAFDLFLADARVLPSLARLLGKAFFKAKKQPVPVDLRGRDWKTPVSDAVRATYFFRGGGSCVNVRVARSSFSPEQVAENVDAALRALVPKLSPGNSGRWAGVRSVLLKSASSAALPVYQSDPRGLDDDDDDDEDDEGKQERKQTEAKKEKKEKKEKKMKMKSAAEGGKTTTMIKKKKAKA